MSSDDEDIRKLIGSRIAIARKAAGLNQEELAAAVGVHTRASARTISALRVSRYKLRTRAHTASARACRSCGNTATMRRQGATSTALSSSA